jgi:anti-sigma factor RsiW
MNVTREVVYDLLPAYFAGEASAETRALVEEFFTTDPEFGRMAARFQAAVSRSKATGTNVDRERESFNRAVARLKLRQAALAWTLGALLAFGIAYLTPRPGVFGFGHPGIIIGVVFSAMAVGTWLLSGRANAERWYRAMVDTSS